MPKHEMKYVYLDAVDMYLFKEELQWLEMCIVISQYVNMILCILYCINLIYQCWMNAIKNILTSF